MKKKVNLCSVLYDEYLDTSSSEAVNELINEHSTVWFWVFCTIFLVISAHFMGLVPAGSGIELRARLPGKCSTRLFWHGLTLNISFKSMDPLTRGFSIVMYSSTTISDGRSLWGNLRYRWPTCYTQILIVWVSDHPLVVVQRSNCSQIWSFHLIWSSPFLCHSGQAPLDFVSDPGVDNVVRTSTV